MPAGTAGVQKRNQRFSLPKREKVPSATETIGAGDPLAAQVTQDMMSGAAFDPYRAFSSEARARTEANQRSLTAGAISRSGQVGQGMGEQRAAGTERDISRGRFDTQLQTEMAEQQLKERGVGVYQRGRGLEADIAFREQGVRQGDEALAEQRAGRIERGEIAREGIGSGERIATKNLAAQREIEANRLSSVEKMHDLDIGEKKLAREGLEKFRQGSLDLSRDEFNALDKARTRGLDLNEEELAALERYRTGQQKFQEKAQNWLEKYQSGLLDISEMDAETRRMAQKADEIYKTGMLKLGQSTLDFNKMSFQQKQDLAEKAQGWLEEFQAGTLDLRKVQQEIDRDYKSALIKSISQQTKQADWEIQLMIDMMTRADEAGSQFAVGQPGYTPPPYG